MTPSSLFLVRSLGTAFYVCFVGRRNYGNLEKRNYSDRKPAPKLHFWKMELNRTDNIGTCPWFDTCVSAAYIREKGDVRSSFWHVICALNLHFRNECREANFSIFFVRRYTYRLLLRIWKAF